MSEQVLPFYLVCDESWSMEDSIGHMNQALVELHKEIASNPVVADKTRLSLIGFAGDAETLLPLSDLSDLETMPGLACRDGGTNFRAAFAATRTQIEDDVRLLKGDGMTVLRPVCFFLSDGAHNAHEDWRKEYTDLISPEFGPHPNIVAFGLGDAEPDAIRRIGTFKAFMAADSISPADALREFVGSLTRSIVKSGSAHDASGAPKLIVEDTVPGFTALDLDTV
ncbi:VWA domain-containing protein [Kocuria coralli]|uniref:VWA domain-containing protein n=1 Tax=Kocuria coralli TaxID=1461025 RepID=A0A5J5KTQ2_9MICC|nr:VWA domain-containing protein [Kocuria coralli]KAA9392882.1 VWA domain-containing protein [Kocuria coralli]